jgi:hypothetical protein
MVIVPFARAKTACQGLTVRTLEHLSCFLVRGHKDGKIASDTSKMEKWKSFKVVKIEHNPQLITVQCSAVMPNLLAGFSGPKFS